MIIRLESDDLVALYQMHNSIAFVSYNSHSTVHLFKLRSLGILSSASEVLHRSSVCG